MGKPGPIHYRCDVTSVNRKSADSAAVYQTSFQTYATPTEVSGIVPARSAERGVSCIFE